MQQAAPNLPSSTSVFSKRDQVSPGSPFLGVISNLKSRQNRVRGYDNRSFERTLGRRGVARSFGSSTELSDAIQGFQNSGVDTIVVNGGDGTFGAVVTEVFHSWSGPRPAFIPLCGGSMNSTARSLGVPRRNVLSVVGDLVERLNGSCRHLMEHDVQTVKVVDEQRERAQYGFVFGSGLVYDYTRYVHSLGGSTAFNSAFGSVLFTINALFNVGRARRVFRDRFGDITVDGEHLALRSFKTAIACGAIFLPSLIRPFPSNRARLRKKFVYLVNGMPRIRLFKQLGSILKGDCRSHLHRTGHASEMTVSCDGGYVLDGEQYPQSAHRAIQVSAGGTVRLLWFPAETNN